MSLSLAMWSGPRNISTAMMRAWENRPDCTAVDEPFYACYLSATGIDHPMRDEVIASQPTDWQTVADSLNGHPEVFYQKHMTHHMLPGINMEWVRDHKHCFLIRDPVRVVASYAEKRSSVTVDDIGIVRQLELYDEISQLTGQDIPVIDAETVLRHPEKALGELCEFFSIPFLSDMLSWPPGRRESDGIWAQHWYQSVEQSTGFMPYEEKAVNLEHDQMTVAEASLEAYRTLKQSPNHLT